MFAKSNIPAHMNIFLSPIIGVINEYIKGPNIFPRMVKLEATPIIPPFLSSGVILLITL